MSRYKIAFILICILFLIAAAEIYRPMSNDEKYGYVPPTDDYTHYKEASVK